MPATMKDIARRTGLGLATISKYLNGGHVLEKNRIAIEAAIEELDFTVNEFARNLKTSKSHTIGVVIPELGNLFTTTIVTALEDTLRRHGYGIIISDCRTNERLEKEAVRFLLGKMVDGIINMPVNQGGGHLLPALEKNIPVVLIDRMIPSLSGRVNAVLIDNAGAACQATSLLLAAGHRDIGILLGPEDVYTTRERLAGFVRAHKALGLSHRADRIYHTDYSTQGAYESMQRLLAGPLPTAIFVTNYEMTLGAMIALSERGLRVPDDVSFIGIDNVQFFQIVKPRLTVMTQPLEQICQSAAGILLSHLQREDGRQVSCQVLSLSTGLLQGDSVRQVKN